MARFGREIWLNICVCVKICRLHHQIAHSPFLSRLMEDLLSIIGRIWQIPVSEWLQAENDYAAIVLGVDFQLFLFPIKIISALTRWPYLTPSFYCYRCPCQMINKETVSLPLDAIRSHYHHRV